MIGDISVCVNGIEQYPNVLRAACKLAEQNNAKLTAVYIRLDTVEIVRWAGSSPMKMANQFLIDQEELERTGHDLFNEIVAEYNCKSQWTTINQSGDPIRQMLCTDLIVAMQPVEDELSYQTDESFINHLILQSRRPVIMIPTTWQPDDGIAEKLLVGWNKSPEAMRAVSDALPILKRVGDTRILHLVQNSLLHGEPENLPDIEAYLSERDVSSTMIVEGADKHRTESELLLEFARENQVNLLIIGGYGHSRFREVILGGVTRHLVEHSPLPVFFSH